MMVANIPRSALKFYLVLVLTIRFKYCFNKATEYDHNYCSISFFARKRVDNGRPRCYHNNILFTPWTL
ncbi:uncharacterized protein PHALS_04809 [Plasmopara halstedii]|uniref:RxLR-like protein n=1 Tax=Plasmopara halstedii TaxID=4781 RepID=A0A0P1B1Q5_PLAHL|nr:uncharacterized protein PHALS_04809 [Plasmopara halstedii]CEG47661.1 hypothetical protein PHALS_04809 [Plasmopara halstedii]|eukprot:XP_024584030.1 hypothetical protein PHALS_04809 [Plasmopara halstedii]